MSILSSGKSRTVVGLDIEAGSIAASEVTTNGGVKLGRTGVAALPPGTTREGEVTDPDALAEVLKEMFAANKLARSVRVGVASQKVMVRTLTMPRIDDEDELEAAIRFQAADQIAMPLDNAVLDWQVLDADATVSAAQQMKVVLVAARKETVGGLVEGVRAAGLKPVGIDVSAFAMIRALAPELPALGAPATEISYEERMAAAGDGDAVLPAPPARLFCALGDVTNLAVASGSTCLFTRVSSFGMEGIAQRLAERRELTLEHSRQWIGHVGFEGDAEDVDGDPEIVATTREVLEEGARKLVDELRLSLDYYGTQDGAVAVEEVVFCGPGSAVAGLPEALSQELGYAMRVSRPSALADRDDAEAARLTLSYGLGLES
ncbi:MAG TPA: type IV pilus assembly protein PilM [Solirubrobacterales bacterium]|nr:type IV pilus assembly protein PilM [Solirubrobacterales bacterium]